MLHENNTRHGPAVLQVPVDASHWRACFCRDPLSAPLCITQIAHSPYTLIEAPTSFSFRPISGEIIMCVVTNASYGVVIRVMSIAGLLSLYNIL